MYTHSIMTTLTRSVVLLLALFAVTANATAQRQVLPEELSDAEVVALSDAWIELGRPTIGVISGVERNGRRDYSRDLHIVQVMTDQFVSQLQRGMGRDSIRNLGRSRAQIERIAEIIGENQAGKLTAGDLARLDELFQPDLFVELIFDPEDGGNGRTYYKPTILVTKVSNESELVRLPWRHNPLPGEQQARRNNRDFHLQETVRLLREFIDALTPENIVGLDARMMQRRFEMILMGDVELEVFDDFLDIFEEFVEDEERDADVKEGQQTAGERGAQRVTVFHEEIRGRQFRRMTSNALEEVEDEYGDTFDFIPMETSDDRLIGQIVLDVPPAWFRIVDQRSDDYEELVGRRRERNDGAPEIVLALMEGIGDMAAPAERFAFKDDTGERESFGLAQLLSETEKWFLDVGFEVTSQEGRDNVAKIDAAAASEFENMEGVSETLAQQYASADFHCVIRTSGLGDDMMLIAELRERDGTLLGVQNWPDTSAMGMQRRKYRVNPSDPESVARFLVGSLTRRFDVAQGRERYIERRIQFTNVDATDAEERTRFAEFKEEIASLRGVDRVRTENASASTIVCEIRYSKNIDESDLVDRIFELARQPKYGAAVVMPAGGAIQINMKPVLAIVEHEEAPAEPRTDATEAPTKAAVVEAAATGGKDLRTTMLTAAESVFAVGIRIDDRDAFIPLGTAWCVADDMLATNAHVVDGVAKTMRMVREEGLTGTVIARGGPSLDKEVVIDRMWRHAEYDRFKGFQQQVWDEYGDRVSLITGYDVGVMHIASGSPGTPLELAAPGGRSISELSAVGYIGFPMENLPGQASAGSPTQLMQTGQIVAMTDYLFKHTDTAEEFLLHYDLNTRGGASGSPVLGGSPGNVKVVALHSAGSAHFIPNLVSRGEQLEVDGYQRVSAGVSYGQRVDVLHELLMAVESQADRIAREVPIP